MAALRPRFALLASICLGVVALQAQPGDKLDTFFRTFTAEWVRTDPQLATMTRYFAGEEQNSLDRRLTPTWTDAFQKRQAELARRGIRELSAFDRAKMKDTERVSADLMKWQLEQVLEYQKYRDYDFPLQQFSGANVELVNALTVIRSVANENDAINYVAALREVRTRMKEAVGRAQELSAKNILPPKFILQATIKQMLNFADPSPAENVLVKVFEQKMDAAKGISVETRSKLLDEAERVVASEVYPAWKEAIGVFEKQLVRATDDAGLWRLKGGPEAYSYFLRYYTTTNLSPDEIHQIGLREVAAIEKEMDTLLRSLGRSEGTIVERVKKLKQDLSYPNTEEGRKQLMADLNGYMRDAEKRSVSLFHNTPKAAVIAEPYPKFREASAAASYMPPPQDGSRPGIFQIPLRPERLTKFALRSLVYHETVPGHHFQVALQVENKELPRFRQLSAFGFISATAEGWGLYAERVAAESGWYEGDVEGRLGQLDSALFRARRLVVDTGIHAQRWTRQQAIDYGIEASEIDRYVVMPGQACSYMLGALKLVELREKAQKALGTKFAAADFHDVVLATGMVPLPILESEVNAYIRKAGAGASKASSRLTQTGSVLTAAAQ